MSQSALLETISCTKSSFMSTGRLKSILSPAQTVHSSQVSRRYFTSQPICLANPFAEKSYRQRQPKKAMDQMGSAEQGDPLNQLSHQQRSNIKIGRGIWNIRGATSPIKSRLNARLANNKIIAAADKGSRVQVPRPEVTAPSAASGGVPDPTPAYLEQANRGSQLLDKAQPLLIVVDLNGTLLHRPNGQRNPKLFVRRPHAFAFMTYMIKNFWVVIWSSARPENVAHMCSNLLHNEAMQDVVAVWDRSRFGLAPADYNMRVQCYKRLRLLWEDPVVAASHPQYSTGGRWSQSNTVLIDDSAEKARSEPFNAITVPEFSNQQGMYDNILPQVHDYLNELCFQSDVSSFMRANPLTLITDAESIHKPADCLAAVYAKKQKKRDKAEARRQTRAQQNQTLEE